MDRADANQQDAATESRSWSEPRTRELRQSQRRAKANERQARRSGDRPDKRRSVRAQEAADIETPTAAFEDETGWVRDETRRPAREAPVRGVRKRSDPADDDDEGYTIVRSHRSRDGRQVTVYEVPRRERQTETRTVIREEPARPRAPFLFDLFNIGGPAD